MRAIVQAGYGSVDQWRLAEIPQPAIADSEVLVKVRAAGIDRGTWHAHDRPALPGPPVLRAAQAEEPGTRVRPRRHSRSGRRRRDQIRGRRRGVRHRRGLLRRVRSRSRGQARPQAGQPFLRAGGGRRRLGAHCAAEPARRRPRPAGTPRAGDRRVRRRRHLRRPDRESLRRRSHRCVQHRQDRPRAVDRRRPRHRLHPKTTSPTAPSATT